MNWINPTSIQWTPTGLGYLGRGTRLNETQPHNTVTQTSPEGISRNLLLWLYILRPPHTPSTLTHISQPHTSQSPFTMQQSIRNQVLRPELYPLWFPSKPTLHTTIQTTEGPSPAGISKSLQSAQEKLSPSKNGLLQISSGGMTLRWEGDKGTCWSSATLCPRLCVEDLRSLPLTLEPGFPTHLTFSRGFWLYPHKSSHLRGPLKNGRRGSHNHRCPCEPQDWLFYHMQKAATGWWHWPNCL